jgi:hypothetical protein
MAPRERGAPDNPDAPSGQERGIGVLFTEHSGRCSRRSHPGAGAGVIAGPPAEIAHAEVAEVYFGSRRLLRRRG